MHPIVFLLNMLIDIYMIFVIASIVMTWLIAFNIINRYQPFVQRVSIFLGSVTDPAYRRIRKYLPPMGGIDLSPIVLIIALQVLRYTINYYF